MSEIEISSRWVECDQCKNTNGKVQNKEGTWVSCGICGGNKGWNEWIRTTKK